MIIDKLKCNTDSDKPIVCVNVLQLPTLTKTMSLYSASHQKYKTLLVDSVTPNNCLQITFVYYICI